MCTISAAQYHSIVFYVHCCKQLQLQHIVSQLGHWCMHAESVWVLRFFVTFCLDWVLVSGRYSGSSVQQAKSRLIGSLLSLQFNRKLVPLRVDNMLA